MAPAFGRPSECDDAIELLAGDVSLLGRGLFVDATLVADCVALREEHQAFGGIAVATSTAGLLVVTLDILGQLVVDDEANVRLVDAHPEGDRRADHLDL